MVNIRIHNQHHMQIVATSQGVIRRSICFMRSTYLIIRQRFFRYRIEGTDGD
jgi:hypothetical protein